MRGFSVANAQAKPSTPGVLQAHLERADRNRQSAIRGQSGVWQLQAACVRRAAGGSVSRRWRFSSGAAVPTRNLALPRS